MSLPQPRKAADASPAADAEEQLFTSATADDGAHLPSVNAQRVNEATLRLVSCAGPRRDEDVVTEEVLIPYAAPVEGVEDGEQPPPPGGWWKSSGLAIAMHLAIVAALV